MTVVKAYPRMMAGLQDTALTISARWVFSAGLTTGSDIYASADSVYDLGQTNTRFRVLYGDDLSLRPAASRTPAANGDLEIQATSNTSITLKLKGSDGVVRSGSVTQS